mgnify:CR=1 FL=1
MHRVNQQLHEFNADILPPPAYLVEAYLVTNLVARSPGKVDAYAEKLDRDYGYRHLQPLDQNAMRQLIGSAAFKGGDIDHDAGHLHPLNFAIGLASAAAKAGVRIHDRSEVHHIDHGPKPVVRTVTTWVASVPCTVAMALPA